MIPKPRKYVYGELNKEIEKTAYGGKDTDTLELIVDNEEGVIYGNVKWAPFLGTEKGTAYPGELGKYNYDRILSLSQSLAIEIDRAKYEEVELDTKIKNESDKREKNVRYLLDRLSALQNELTAVASELSEEIHRSVEADSLLESKLDVEVETRRLADDKLQKEIDTLGEGLDVARGNISDIEEDITTINNDITNINNNIITIKDDITSINGDISIITDDIVNINETISDVREDIVGVKEDLTDVKNEIEQNVEVKLQTLEETVDEKTSLLSNSISVVSASVEAEKTTREGADELLAQTIANEVNRAQNEENRLTEELNNISEKLTDDFVVSVKDDSVDVTKVYAVRNNNDFVVEASIGSPNTIVVRDSYGYLEATDSVDDFSSLRNTSAVPKAYADLVVQQLSERVEEELSKILSIDTIVAGTAPIN